MNYPRFTSRWLFLSTVALILVAPLRAQTPDGAIAGIVSNAGTGDLLEGVRVAIPSLGIATLTDATGRYIFGPVPAGSHEVTANYTGLEPQRLAVTVETGRRATRDFALTAGVYRLDAFTVAGELEGAPRPSRRSATPPT